MIAIRLFLYTIVCGFLGSMSFANEADPQQLPQKPQGPVLAVPVLPNDLQCTLTVRTQVPLREVTIKLPEDHEAAWNMVMGLYSGEGLKEGKTTTYGKAPERLIGKGYVVQENWKPGSEIHVLEFGELYLKEAPFFVDLSAKYPLGSDGRTFGAIVSNEHGVSIAASPWSMYWKAIDRIDPLLQKHGIQSEFTAKVTVTVRDQKWSLISLSLADAHTQEGNPDPQQVAASTVHYAPVGAKLFGFSVLLTKRYPDQVKESSKVLAEKSMALQNILMASCTRPKP
ncbi:MAG: hypothetical protein AB1540_00215 [Bdellovibrionota bacterium]